MPRTDRRGLLVVLQNGRVVIVEDTSIHDNDMVWGYTPQ